MPFRPEVLFLEEAVDAPFLEVELLALDFFAALFFCVAAKAPAELQPSAIIAAIAAQAKIFLMGSNR